MGMCACEWMCLQSPEEGDRSPGGEAGSHELPNAQNWAQVSARAVNALSCGIIPLILLARFWLSDYILWAIFNPNCTLLNVHMK